MGSAITVPPTASGLKCFPFVREGKGCCEDAGFWVLHGYSSQEHAHVKPEQGNHNLRHGGVVNSTAARSTFLVLSDIHPRGPDQYPEPFKAVIQPPHIHRSGRIYGR